jgi:hypothetical protein
VSRHLALALLALALALPCAGCRRDDASGRDALQAEIQSLEGEREALRARLLGVVPNDPRLGGMPQADARFGIPTGLARLLIERVVTGFVDRVTIALDDLKIEKSGTVKKGITLGEYDLKVLVHEVRAELRTGAPEIAFGGDTIRLALPIVLASGTGRATVDFDWDGRNVAGAVCGDLQIDEEVAGSVVPDRYPIRGALTLSATAREIQAAPRFPETRVNLKVEPSEASWAAVRRVADEQTGLCGFVLDRVDIPGVLEKQLAQGFDVTLPTEKLGPMAVPVGIQPTMTIRGKPITLDVESGGLAITEHMIWLGANVAVTTP